VSTQIFHPASGVQPWEDAYPQFARNMGNRSGDPEYFPST